MTTSKLARDYTISFPAIRGIQAGREYYSTMCPLHLLPKMFNYDDEEVPSELRAQRTLNKGRIPALTRYIVENPDTYIFSAITASIDAEVDFTAFGEDTIGRKIGILSVPMDAKFLINDGQHRRAAIEAALEENPAIGHETIDEEKVSPSEENWPLIIGLKLPKTCRIGLQLLGER